MPDSTSAAARLEPTIFFVLPAYNEEPNIERQLTTIRGLMERKGFEYTVLVVDDGSHDGTAAAVQALAGIMPVRLIQHNVNRGVGKAFQTGFEAVMESAGNDDIIITMDADTTQNLRTVELMVEKINAGYEVVLGSTFAPGGMMIGAPFNRYVLSWVCNLMYRILFPIRGIHTYTGFYRAYSGAAIRQSYEHFGDRLIKSSGFVVMAELLVKFRQIPLFITEVPMIMRYNLRGGPSKMPVLRTIGTHLAVMLKHLPKRRII